MIYPLSVELKKSGKSSAFPLPPSTNRGVGNTQKGLFYLENIFLIDWFTFTVKKATVEQVKSLIGLSDSYLQGSSRWEELGGCNGYPKSEMYNGIRIMYGASEDMGICVNMSGQGCRTFESFGSGDWMQLFRVIEDPLYADFFNITRLDLAFDDHTGLLDIDQVEFDLDAQNWTAKFRWWKCEYGSEGISLYMGSPKSDIRCRIYDKAAERGLENQHWVRIELQLRRGNASTAVHHIVSGLPVGTVFIGVLRNYIQFREPAEDTNKARWPLADYWEKLLDGALPLTLWVKPGCEYNLEKLQRFVIDQAGNAISCYVMIYGYEGLEYFLKTHKRVENLPPKYKMLLDLAKQGNGGFVYDEDENEEDD